MRFSCCALLITATLQQRALCFHTAPIFIPSLCSKCHTHKPFSSSPSLIASSSLSSSSWQLRSSKNDNINEKEDKENVLDYFDPLRSPHAYPDGIDSKKDKKIASNVDDDWSPLQMKNVKNDFSGASELDYTTQKLYYTGDWAGSTQLDESASAVPDSSTVNTDDSTTNGADYEFDPLISPHAYKNGASSKPVLEKSSSTTAKSSTPPPRIGVLLIDHGSKRPSSNDHLLKVASLYQSKAPSNIVVRAAHMEIVAPSILDGIGALWKEDEVDKIICHPYFLSPGRHVAEDVPELIHGAVVEINGGEIEEEGKVWDGKEGLFLGNGDAVVEVIMTEPVGSNINRMVDIIGDMVEGSLGEDGIVARPVVAEKENIGGFFGNVQRMMDEQL